MSELPPGVEYRPGRLACRLSGAGQDMGLCPVWSITGEDGTVYRVWREDDEVNGQVVDPDGTARTCWDLGRGQGDHTPLGRASHWPEAEQATDVELAAMNRILRPVALARPWAEELAAAEPCDHQHRWWPKPRRVVAS